jgi:exodeoxyribonuclease III
MKIATFNVNGVKTRLAHLLRWLEREQPDVACLQELKALDEAFPAAAIEAAGYHALWQGQRSWNGVAILARAQPVEVRRALPGDPGDTQSRYLEAAIDGVIVGCLYLPNGNPQPGPKFEYKLAWFERLIAHAATLVDSGHPVVLCGDYNVVPTDADIYNPRSWRKDALLQPQTRACWRRAGPMPSATCTRRSRSTPSGTTSASTGSAMRACASTTCCSIRRWHRPCGARAWTPGSAARRRRATMHRRGSNWSWVPRRSRGRVAADAC